MNNLPVPRVCYACHNIFTLSGGERYCPHCGKKLNWEKLEKYLEESDEAQDKLMWLTAGGGQWFSRTCRNCDKKYVSLGVATYCPRCGKKYEKSDEEHADKRIKEIVKESEKKSDESGNGCAIIILVIILLWIANANGCFDGGGF